MQNDNQPTQEPDSNPDHTSPPPKSVGGQRVIQPTPEILQHVQAEQEVVQPEIISPTPTPVQAQSSPPPQSTVPQPAYPRLNVPHGSEIQTEKRHLPWPRIIKIALVLIILGSAGAILATNQNIRATVFRQKLVAYNYPVCKTHICTMKFYKGSKVGSYTPPTLPGDPPSQAETALVSPVIDGKTNLAMRVSMISLTGANTDVVKQILAAFNVCSSANPIPFNTVGFSEYLPNMDANIKVCAVSVDNDSGMVLAYTTAFESQKTNALVDVIISENFAYSNSQGQISTPIFNLADHQKEIQSILASMNSKNK
jgi:hypothetical protein